MIPENPPDPQYRVRIDPKKPVMLKPFSQEELDEAIRQAGLMQEPRFENLKEAEKHAANVLMNSDDLSDIGRAYAYAYQHSSAAMRGIVIKAIAILTSVKGYHDFILKKQAYDQNALLRTGKRLILPQPNAPITPLLGQEESISLEPRPITETELILDDTKVDIVVEASESEVTLELLNPVSAEVDTNITQEQALDNYFNEISDQVNDAEYFELSYLHAVFQKEQADQISFRQKYIILHDLFDGNNREKVVETTNRLNQETGKKAFNLGDYRKRSKGAFNELMRITEGALRLYVSEDEANNSDAFDRLGNKIETRHQKLNR